MKLFLASLVALVAGLSVQAQCAGGNCARVTFTVRQRPVAPLVITWQSQTVPTLAEPPKAAKPAPPAAKVEVKPAPMPKVVAFAPAPPVVLHTRVVVGAHKPLATALKRLDEKRPVRTAVVAVASLPVRLLARLRCR